MCNDGYEVFQKFAKDEWRHAWKHILICVLQEADSKKTWDTQEIYWGKSLWRLVRRVPARGGQGDTSDRNAGLPPKKKGKKGRKEIFECYAILKEFWQGWQNPCTKIASRKNLVAVRKSSFISLICLVDDWKQLRWDWCFDTITVMDFRGQQLTSISW